MQAPRTPIDEVCRLEALQSLGLLDSKPDPRFESLVRIGQALFDIEICLVSLVDTNRQWFLARAGLDAPETPRDISFCGHAILSDNVFVIRDAAKDERFFDNPLVTSSPFIRFYAGVPLRIPIGYKLGTLCIISPKPRPDFNRDDEVRLRDLGNLAINAIAARAIREDSDRLRATHDAYRTLCDISSAPMALVSESGTVTSSNPAFAAFCGVADAEGRPVESMLDIGSDWKASLSQARQMKVQRRGGGALTVTLYPAQSGYMAVG